MAAVRAPIPGSVAEPQLTPAAQPQQTGHSPPVVSPPASAPDAPRAEPPPPPISTPVSFSHDSLSHGNPATVDDLSYPMLQHRRSGVSVGLVLGAGGLGLAMAAVLAVLLLPGERPLEAKQALATLPKVEVPQTTAPSPSNEQIAPTPSDTKPEETKAEETKTEDAKAEEPAKAEVEETPASTNAAPGTDPSQPRPGSQFLAVLDTPATGVLNVSSNVACSLWLNGGRRGTARGASFVVGPGYHTLACRIETGRHQTRRVKVVAGDKVSVGFRF